MKILVTGTAGFIGMHLAEKLIGRGHEVVGIDNFNAYYDVALKNARHARLESLKGYTGYRMDVCDAPALRGLFDAHRFDAVCNLAAQPGVRYSLEHPEVYIRSNVEGFANILEACRHAPATPKLIYASTSSVYGGNVKLPFSEDDPVDNPVSLYAATKKANELMAHTYSHLFGLHTVGLRFFTVYGPWGRPDMAPWLFTEALSQGKPITVFNHGNMKRDFTYIDDIIQGVVAALESTTLGRYEIFNIGNNRAEALMDFIQTIADALGVKPQMEMAPMQPGDVLATYADITRIHDKLGYTPTTPISVGIPKFIEWYQEWRN